MQSGTLAGQYPDLDLNQGLNLRRVQCKSATPSGQRHEREESNPVEQFWRLSALPGAHSCKSNGYPKGVEPLPPGSQPGVQRPLHHRHDVNQQLDQDLNPELVVRTVT